MSSSQSFLTSFSSFFLTPSCLSSVPNGQLSYCSVQRLMSCHYFWPVRPRVRETLVCNVEYFDFSICDFTNFAMFWKVYIDLVEVRDGDVNMAARKTSSSPLASCMHELWLLLHVELPVLGLSLFGDYNCVPLSSSGLFFWQQ